MIEAFYLVKESGLPIYTFHQDGKEGSEFDDLVSPFLAAIDLFSAENFKGRIKAIVLEDNRKLYFRSFKIGGKKLIKFIALADTDNIGELDGKMINLKWIMEKLGKHLGDPAGGIPRVLEAEIVERITGLLASPVQRPANGQRQEPAGFNVQARRSVR
ncbi:MAG: hypothetical protein JW839_19155 [Candidatus Lokiarchaeota archaeon]|nr:hypothetical protein [Candidatus Lokiarchaeota archaeon]